MNRREFLVGTVALPLLAKKAVAKTDAAVRLIQGKVDSGELAGAVLQVRHGERVTAHAFGVAKPGAVFYLAKTKDSIGLGALAGRWGADLENIPRLAPAATAAPAAP